MRETSDLLSELTSFFPPPCSWWSASGIALWATAAQEPSFCRGENIRGSLCLCMRKRYIRVPFYWHTHPQYGNSNWGTLMLGIFHPLKKKPQTCRPAIPKKFFLCHRPVSIHWDTSMLSSTTSTHHRKKKPLPLPRSILGKVRDCSLSLPGNFCSTHPCSILVR